MNARDSLLKQWIEWRGGWPPDGCEYFVAEGKVWRVWK